MSLFTSPNLRKMKNETTSCPICERELSEKERVSLLRELLGEAKKDADLLNEVRDWMVDNPQLRCALR